MEKQYIRSERAHYMCPNMCPNMYFGIDLVLNVTKDFEKVQECLDIIAKEHPFLRSRIKYDKDSTDIYYDVQNISTIELNNRETAETARQVHRIVKKNVEANRSLMLVLSRYLRMNKDLIDAAAISSLGDYKSKAGEFVGSNMFGYSKRDGVSLTNLGCIDNESIINAKFIPPASPATIQTIGVLTVNGKMNLCSSYYEKAVSAKEVSILLEDMSQCKQ